MKFLIVFIFSIFPPTRAIPTTTTPLPTYNKWLLQYEKNFDPKTKSDYQRIWDENVRLIAEYKKLNLSFILGVNSFTHLSSDDFIERYCGTTFPVNYQPLKPMLMGPIKNKLNNYTLDNLPDEFDWRDYIEMQPVVSQKRCGACWAFAAMALLG